MLYLGVLFKRLCNFVNMSHLKQVALAAIIFLISSFHLAHGQYEIDQQGTVNDCSANFHDSDSTGTYQNNETYIMTFCPDGGGNSINMGFGTLFDVDPSDTLYVYDGSSTAAPLIGAYNNNNPLTGVSTTTSGSGCLTFKFVSDGAGVSAGWLGIINCLTICQPIDAVITTNPAVVSYGPDSNYTNICAGDNVPFSATGTYPDNGANPYNYVQSDATTTFEWEFGNGGVATGTNTNSTYINEQGYLVLLTVTDVNGCIELVRHKVRTGITPQFAGIYAAPDTVCFADTVSLYGGFTQAVGQNSTVTVDTGYVSAGGIVSGQTYLPDGNGNSYSTLVNIGGFSGQTIQNGSDISTVCMNIEHSYIGDLDMTLTCPNGTTITLMDGFNGAGNGGTYLGDAQDDFAVGNGVPGIGLDYCFDLTAAWGTMTDENINNNWIPSTVTPGNNILTPGSFQPLQSFNGFIGCPIDGDWTITITDNIGSDDGFIFEWGIQLDPSITPNIEAYTVNMLNGVWQPHADIINDYDTLAIAYPSITGDNFYTFQVTDEFGCTFDTVITVHSLPELILTTVDSTMECQESLTLPLKVLGSTLDCQENVSVSGQDDDPATLATFNNYTCVPPGADITAITLDATIGNFCGAASWYTYDIIINGVTQFTQQCDQTGLDLTPFLPITSIVLDANDEDNFSDNVTLDLILNVTYSYYPYNYSWTPGATLSDTTIRNPLATPEFSTDYIVTIVDTNYGCIGTDTASITMPIVYLDPVISIENITCNGLADAKIVASATGANPLFDIAFFDNAAPPNLLGGSLDVLTDSLLNLTSGDYNVVITDTAGCAFDTLLTFVEPTPVVISTISPNDTICINDTITIFAEAAGGMGIDSIIWDNGLIGDGPHNVMPTTDSTDYYVYAVDSNGCQSTVDTVTILWFDPITLNPLLNNRDSICPGDTTELSISAYGGHDSTTFYYEWHNGSNNLIGIDSNIIVIPGSPGETFTVTVKDDCTTPSQTATVTIFAEPIPQPVFTMDTTEGCVPVQVIFNNTTTEPFVAAYWDFGDGNNSSNTLTETNNYNVPGTYSVSLRLTSIKGCVGYVNYPDTIKVHAYPNPNFDFGPTPADVVNSEINFYNNSHFLANDSYLWTFTSGIPETSIAPNPIVNFPFDSSGVYPVRLIVTSDFGCADTSYQDVVINDRFLYYIPNTFTPDGNGLNDTFRPYGNESVDFDTFHMQIFNRWGELLYETTDVNQGWDGSYKGRQVPQGSYVWKIEVKELHQPTIHAKTGTFTLLRKGKD